MSITQHLANLLTMQEHLPGKTFNEMTLVYAATRVIAWVTPAETPCWVGSPSGRAKSLLAAEAALVAECSAMAAKKERRRHHPDRRYRLRRKGAVLSIPMFGSIWASKRNGRAYCPAALSGQQPDDGVNRQSAG